MDSIKIGYFIAECRKEKQITQQQLADLLNITNKAVSKWETGNGLPDIAILTELASILDVTVDEILRAKKNDHTITVSEDSKRDINTQKEKKDNTDAVISYLVHKSINKFKLMAIVSTILSIVGVIIQYFIWSETKDLTGWLFGCWFEVCSAGVFYYYRTMMKNQIEDYNATADIKQDVKDITNPYLRVLIVAWVVMLFTIFFYLI
ncbi:helix-turn-helix domain-containing protein [Anaeromicropila herbilytica]|uniref:HTH cro/C1-type domain-containing protein n=1 Tax=Anaeromicropila herbilytica TaxID=2785025 RepID=A0A7R7IBQ6_9FIRM|nr:helix-turn-helix transcriptional regulator [Anaeromicropila herbilytica]BCN29074.1 hypothetical protein bsdtb5_03690 [Anaeromicropila herbilytica]